MQCQLVAKISHNNKAIRFARQPLSSSTSRAWISAFDIGEQMCGDDDQHCGKEQKDSNEKFFTDVMIGVGSESIMFVLWDARAEQSQRAVCFYHGRLIMHSQTYQNARLWLSLCLSHQCQWLNNYFAGPRRSTSSLWLLSPV